MGADLRSLLLWVNELPSCSGAGKESPHGKVAARSSAGWQLWQPRLLPVTQSMLPFCCLECCKVAGEVRLLKISFP